MNHTGMLIGIVATVVLAPLSLAVAQAAPPSAPSNVTAPAPTFDARAAVAEVRRVVAANYVLTEMRPRLDAALARGIATGRYDVSDPNELARRVNADLAEVAHDKHLGLMFDPQMAAGLGTERHRDDGPPTADDIQGARLRNHGIVELKWLAGNVRYMEVRGFLWTGAESARAYDDAMRFLSGGDAVIIDLRRNGGGSPDAVQYLISHFIEPNRPIVTFYMGSDVDARSSLMNLPAGRMVGKPLYVLTSPNSASAAEEFIGHVAGFRLGEVIGATSAGAGFRNDHFPIPGGFVMSVSVGRAVLASTGKDWEGVGIAPTAPVDPSRALEVAEIHAWRRLAATASPDQKADLEGMAALLAVQLDPVTPALPLTAYAGRYGPRTVQVENARLTWQREGSGKLLLVPTGPNSFIFEEDPGTRVEFTVSGTVVTAGVMIRADGERVPLNREP